MTGPAHLLAPLSATVFTIGNDHVSLAWLLGFALAAACVRLAVAARVSSFPAGVASSAFLGVLYSSAHLYASACLRVVYIALGFAGWWQWRYGGTHPGRLAVSRAGPRMLAGCLLFTAAGSGLLTVVLSRAAGIAPLWEALATTLSLTAQFLLNCKRIETWVCWLLADLIYVPLCLATGLDLTAAMYLLLAGLSGLGLVTWRNALPGAGREAGHVLRAASGGGVR